jgi:tetratricopeptide (TPR) repeat protein
VLAPELAAQMRAEPCALLLQDGRPAEAERCARAVLSTGARDPLAFEVVGAARLQVKDYKAGEQMLRQAIRVEPGLLGARLDLGNALVAEGRFQEAIEVLREAQRLSPDNSSVVLALMRAETAAGKYRASLATAQTAMPELRRSEEGLTVLISDALGAQDQPALKGYLGDWAGLEHTSSLGAMTIARMMIDKGFEAEAIPVLRDAELREPTSFDVRLLLGEVYARTGATAQANEEFDAALRLQDGSWECLVRLAHLAEASGQLETARSLLLQAGTLRPNEPEVLTGLGKVSLEMDLPDDAIASLSSAAKLRPDHEPTQYLLASAYTSSKRYSEALPILEMLAARHPSDALFPYSVGAVLYLSGDYSAAERELRKSLALDPKGVGALYYLGLTLRRQERTAEAEDVLHTLLRQSNQHAAGLAALGELLMQERRFAEAKTTLEEAVRLDGSSTDAHYALGRTLAHLGLKDAAQAQFAILGVLNRPQ